MADNGDVTQKRNPSAQSEGRAQVVFDNVQRFSFGGAAAQTSLRGFRSLDPRR